MFRRAKNYDAGEKFLGRAPAGRRRGRDRGQDVPPVDSPPVDDEDMSPDAAPSADEALLPEGTGPFDASEVDRDALADTAGVLDLGSLLVKIPPGVDVQLPVADDGEQVLAALLVMPESAVEVTVFAAPRSGGQWASVVDEIAAQATQDGGTADQVIRPHGIELRLKLPGEVEGKAIQQDQRLWGFDGPRWMLRANIIGRAAVDDDLLDQVFTILSSVVVDRGSEARAPREPLPLRLPPGIPAVPASADG